MVWVTDWVAFFVDERGLRVTIVTLDAFEMPCGYCDPAMLEKTEDEFEDEFEEAVAEERDTLECAATTPIFGAPNPFSTSRRDTSEWGGLFFA